MQMSLNISRLVKIDSDMPNAHQQANVCNELPRTRLADNVRMITIQRCSHVAEANLQYTNSNMRQEIYVQI